MLCVGTGTDLKSGVVCVTAEASGMVGVMTRSWWGVIGATEPAMPKGARERKYEDRFQNAEAVVWMGRSGSEDLRC